MAHKVQLHPLTYDSAGRSHYCFLLETALACINQARELVKGDVIDTNYELVKIQTLITEALEAS